MATIMATAVTIFPAQQRGRVLGLIGSIASPLWVVGGLLALIGAALGLFNSPNNSAVMGALGRDQLGMANGIVSTLRNLGRAVFVAGTLVGAGAFVVIVLMYRRRPVRTA